MALNEGPQREYRRLCGYMVDVSNHYATGRLVIITGVSVLLVMRCTKKIN